MKYEQCIICGKGINLETDDYVHLIDYKLGELYMQGYYHNLCYHQAVHKKTMNLIEMKARNMLQNLKGLNV